MNVIWIVSDTFRRDHLGCYGNKTIHTPSLDTLAAKSVRFDRYYAADFPTMPTRADHLLGRWTGCFMRWEPIPRGQVTLPQILTRQGGVHTAGLGQLAGQSSVSFRIDNGVEERGAGRGLVQVDEPGGESEDKHGDCISGQARQAVSSFAHAFDRHRHDSPCGAVVGALQRATEDPVSSACYTRTTDRGRAGLTRPWGRVPGMSLAGGPEPC